MQGTVGIATLIRTSLKMPYFRRDGIEFYFEEHGSGRPLIFSHGLGGNLNRACDLVRGLPDLHLIVYDNRAHGRTKPLGDPAKLTFGEMADDLAALLDHLSIPSAVIGGVSMGAGIALACAVRHRHRVKALVLSRPAWLDFPNPPNLAFAEIISKLVEEFGPEQALPKFKQSDFYKSLQQRYPETAKSLHDVFVGWNAEALVASYRALPASTPVDSLDKLRDLNVQAIVLGNRNDPVHPFEFAEAWARVLPGARLREFPSKSENPTEHLRRFRQFLTEFLAGMD